MVNNAQHWIQHLKLQPHPEGGYYAETYKSKKFEIKNESSEIRQSATLIYFLLKDNEYSAFHRLKSDEAWLYHKGCSVNIYIIDKVGQLRIEKFGSDVANGENLQVLIPSNSWFAAELIHKSNFCLMSCLVSPGFEWKDFELGNKKELTQLYPDHLALFDKFCII